MQRLLLALMVLVAGRAGAAERVYSVTSFDHIRVEGPYSVEVSTGRSSAARAIGDTDAIDRLTIEVQGTTLIVRPNKAGWGGWPGAPTGTVRIVASTPAIAAVLLSGAGSVVIDRTKGARLDLQAMGSGMISVGSIETESLAMNLTGAGSLCVAGQAEQVRAVLQGPGAIHGAGLTAADAEINAAGSGDLSLFVERDAKVIAAGSGNVTIDGPAACIVRQTGSGNVTCAHRKAD